MTRSILRAVVLTGAFAAAVLHTSDASAQTPVQLDGIVVTGTATPLERSKLGNHVTLIRGVDLVERGIFDVTDALREVPGIAVARSGSFGGLTSIFMRGGESDYVQVMIDGVQVNQPGGSFDFSGLTAENIERIEIVRGPSSALHGSDAVAGVIHIITKSGAPDADVRAGASFRAGSFGRFDTTLDLSGGTERASYGVTLARYRTDGILDFNNQFENTVLTGKAQLQIDERTTATVAARVGDRQFNFPTDFSGAIVDQNQFGFNDETSVALTIDRRLSDRVTLIANANTYTIDSGSEDRPDSPADSIGGFAGQSLNNYRRNALDVRAAVILSEAAALTVGGELEEQRIRAFSVSESSFFSFDSRSSNRRNNRAAFAHLNATSGAFDANAGVRFEDNEFFGGFTTWQLGASFAASETTRLRGLVGRAIREPTFAEAFATGFALGNPDLDPETSTSLELGVEQSLLEGRVTVQATWFQQSFEELIQFTGAPPAPGDPNYFNVAEADASGFEFSGQATLGRVQLFGDFTLLDTEVIDSGFQQGEGATFVEGQSLLRRPDQSGRLGVGVTLTDGIRVDGVLRHVGERDDRDFNAFPAEAVTLEAYDLLDLSLSARIIQPTEGRPGFDLTLRAENLTDEEFQEIFGFGAPGRGLYVGGRIGWGR